jgi:hypothetical protein
MIILSQGTQCLLELVVGALHYTYYFPVVLNSLTAIGAHERQLLIELLVRVVSPRINICCWRLIARKIATDSSFLAVNRNFNEACISNDVSRVSLSCLFCASFMQDCGL